MGRISAFFFGILVGGVLVYGGQRYYVLRTNDGVELVPKLSPGLSETYVDVRNFKETDWANHKSLVAAILHAKKENIFTDSAADKARQGLDGLVDQLHKLAED